MTSNVSSAVCPMCGTILQDGRRQCSQCGENAAIATNGRRRTTLIDIILAACLGFGALALTLNACATTYFSCQHRIINGPRASEFNGDLTPMEWTRLFFDVCQTPLIRGGVGTLWLWAFPCVGWVIQSLRERRGAVPMSRLRLFWCAELSMVFVTATLVMAIVFSTSNG